MLSFLTDREVQILREAQKAYRNEGRIYIKITALLMLDQGFSVVQVGDALGIDRATAYRYHQSFLAQGLDDYLDLCIGGSVARLSPADQALLGAHLEEHFYLNARDICRYVLETFGISYSENGMISLLHRLNFVYKKSRRVVPHADVEKQEAFVEQLTQKAESLEEREGLYFMDGTHPQHNTRPDYGWIRKGKDFKIKANSGRARVNINGLMNAFDPTDLCAITAERINAQATIELFTKLKAQNPEKSHFYVVCDNARYYHAKCLQEWLADQPITLIFLPAYAPNLNLIERLWKFLKKKVINSNYYDTYDKFHQAILDFFTHIEDYEKELKSLISWKFEIIR
jgi:transposase